MPVRLRRPVFLARRRLDGLNCCQSSIVESIEYFSQRLHLLRVNEDVNLEKHVDVVGGPSDRNGHQRSFTTLEESLGTQPKS
jgi:hypothetical protein